MRSVALSVAGAFAGVLLLAGAARAATEPAVSPAAASTNAFHGVVIYDLAIDGRVFIISEKRDDKGRIPDPRPAANVRVEVRTVTDDKVVAEASTDEQGQYSIPKIDVGIYKVHIGLLRMDLQIRPATEAHDSKASRAFIVLVPEEMAPAER